MKNLPFDYDSVLTGNGFVMLEHKDNKLDDPPFGEYTEQGFYYKSVGGFINRRYAIEVDVWNNDDKTTVYVVIYPVDPYETSVVFSGEVESADFLTQLLKSLGLV